MAIPDDKQNNSSPGRHVGYLFAVVGVFALLVVLFFFELWHEMKNEPGSQSFSIVVSQLNAQNAYAYSYTGPYPETKKIKKD